MSAVLRTLAQFRAGVARTADINIAASGVRHTNALVDLDINRSIARWWQMMAECGEDQYTRSIALTTTPSVAYVNPSEAILFIRAMLAYSGTRPVPLTSLERAERGDLFDESGSELGFPRYYKLGFSTTTGTSTHYVRIYPVPDAVYDVTLSFVPPPKVLTSDGDTVEVLSGGDEWIMNDAALHILRHDGHADASPALMSMLMQENAKYERDLRFVMGCRNPIRKLDTRGMERRNRYGVRNRW
jgi:hypothetical protein